jgi:hypothetical protein
MTERDIDNARERSAAEDVPFNAITSSSKDH